MFSVGQWPLARPRIPEPFRWLRLLSLGGSLSSSSSSLLSSPSSCRIQVSHSGRQWTISMCPLPQACKHNYAWKHAPWWRWTCKPFGIWGKPSRCAAAEEPSASRWRSNIQRREDSGPAGTPRYSGSTYTRRSHICISNQSSSKNLATFCPYQKGKMIILETIKTTVNTTNMALAVRCQVA